MKNLFKTLTCVFVIISVLCAPCSSFSAEPSNDPFFDLFSTENKTEDNTASEYCNLEYVKFCENSKGSLFVNEKSGRFYFEDVSGCRWYSNPDMGDIDANAGGAYKMELQSLILFEYYDYEVKQLKKANSEALSVRFEDAEIKKTENGFKAIYNFDDLGFKIPLEVSLDEYGITAMVNCEDLVEQQEEKRIFNISVLPYFGAGASDEEGYIFIADGCGCVMNFNNGTYTRLGYSSKIYGEDLSKYVITKSGENKAVNFPVFGIKKPLSAVTAIVTEGAAFGTFKCWPNNIVTSYSNVYTEFELRSIDTVVLNEDHNSASSITLYEDGDINPKKLNISYRFVTGENVGYNEMAATYKEYLIQKYKIEKTAQNFSGISLEFNGAVKSKKSIFGIPMKVNTKLSTVKGIEKFCKTLYKNGIEGMNVTLSSWSREQLSGKIDNSLNPVRCFGERKEIEKLAKFLKSTDSTLALSLEMQIFHSSGKGYNKWSHSAKAQSNAPIYIYDYYKSIFKKNKDIVRLRLIKPTKLSVISNNVLKSSDDYDDEIIFNLAESSSKLYSDFASKRTSNIEETRLNIENTFKTLSSRKLSFNFPADYAIKYANNAEDIPLTSSQNRIFDYDVPFVQLVLSGLVEYSSEPINLRSDRRKAVLDSIAYGANLKYSLITENAYSVVGTEKDSLYYAQADNLYDEITDYYDVFSNISSAIEKSIMISHSKEGNISKSLYSDGKIITVNYLTGEVIVSNEDKEIYKTQI